MNQQKNVSFWSGVEIDGQSLETQGFKIGEGWQVEHEMVTSEGSFFGMVFFRKNSFGDRELVTDQAIIDQMKAMYADDQIVDAKRDATAKDFAEKLHGGDERAESMIRMHLEFEDSLEPYSMEREGGMFYQVGRNASHQFYFGMKEGQAYRYACGEGWEDEDTGEWNLDESQYPVDNWDGYCGHF
ncbi:hypothetical protein HOK15_06220 [Candidatus Falkowbacteria bacterium]|nr:hypothetical protein [Candidatus Falkowbacteria bacterium]